MEEITDKIDHVKEDRIMNIKENFYIYTHKQCNKLMIERKAYKDNHRIIVFDTAMTYIDTPS
jgi:hypothetical protein